MDVLFDLVIGLGVIGGGYFWVKTKLLNPDIPQDIEIFPSRGVPLVKRSHDQQATAETGSAKIAVVEQVDSAPEASEAVLALSESTVASVGVESVSSLRASTNQAPEDSVLKRHYLAQRVAERQAITHPYPTDSVLRRHVESALVATFAPTKRVKKTTEVEPVEATASDAAILASPKIELPQDSVLKRHYQQLLESKLAENLA
ncbi:MAG: hypothetical protein M0R33_00510 [Methylomonas sp.]|jgi:hypothetical protein|uniref:hypothetical protein n=1 Tax=Methylomonas sp. TaxID=418 RepID=UPI0025FAAE4C|nr:hypothetical protein [Methylomonas sp.]MCK9604915.1 hypothetical protein [Methylomonas sp.]